MALQRRLKEYDAFNIRISKEIHKELQLLKVDTQISKGLLIEMALYDLLKKHGRTTEYNPYKWVEKS
ncbi:TPA: hypothetical protein QC364_003678 [Bacillus cereus]|uniref:hypothetical protein n=1 Tax=Bacillus cereus group TaxID=86661 RepID=UPI0022E6D18A|nr:MULTISPECIES: hypothetical protein [unclassified Bacillus cereus group]HDR7969543.1 hypothetical protein [Bacillus pacificus]HDR8456799.1 hypothetical protein [Bacillus cereus]MDA2681106.1 hypothetical protein [Bacillus cereus group sp. Bc029]MDA2742060.1 hypothetical protein [Bacillus cereus group sp. Bc011]HDW3055573.1 hypothetical protein [Bacillus cereus]